MKPLAGHGDYDKELVARAKTHIKATLETLEKHLKMNSYLAGNIVTIADIYIAALLTPLIRFVLVDKFVKNFQAVTKWYESILALDYVKKILGGARYASKTLEYPKETKEVKEKEEKKPAKEAKKPAEKKKDDDDEEEEVKKEEKDPLDSLPTTKMNIN